MAEKNEAVKAKRVRKPAAPQDPNAPKCIVPECGRVAKTRGLCATCYSVARQLVKDCVATWELLEAAGKVQGRGGRNGTQRAKAKAFLLG